MRFSFGCSVIASILASVSLVGTVESVSVLRGNDGLKQTLMKNAVPVDMVEGKPILPNQQHQQSSKQEKGQARRKVEEDQEEERFEITGDYTIQFNSCISLKTGPSYENGNGDDGGNGDILFNSDLIGYTQGGKIVNEKSFVLFNVCKTEYCSYYNQDTASTYMIDINAYMQALTQYYLDEQQKFCASCYYNYEYCE